ANGNGGLTSYLGVTGSDNDVNAQINGPTNGIFDVSSHGTSNTLMVGERPPAANLFLGWWAASDYDTLLSTRQLYGDIFGAGGCVLPGVEKRRTKKGPDLRLSRSGPLVVGVFWCAGIIRPGIRDRRRRGRSGPAASARPAPAASRRSRASPGCPRRWR